MLVVAIDTSGRNGSVALCREDATNFAVLQKSALEGGTYSARLVPSIADLLRAANLSKSQIDAFVVVDGPGSFTGLRVGLSTVKAFCEALQKPLAVVSMLEALVVTYGREGETLNVLLDAGRAEVYAGEYKIAGPRAELIQNSIVKLSDFVGQPPAQPSRFITTSAKVVEALGTRAALVDPLDAEAIARIGLRKLIAGDTTDPATLDANYIRRSDAELFAPPK
jgi:tRNA threonylcarbamoyladenosine biosynthesis protein TsaB